MTQQHTGMGTYRGRLRRFLWLCLLHIFSILLAGKCDNNKGLPLLYDSYGLIKSCSSMPMQNHSRMRLQWMYTHAHPTAGSHVRKVWPPLASLTHSFHRILPRDVEDESHTGALPGIAIFHYSYPDDADVLMLVPVWCSRYQQAERIYGIRRRCEVHVR